MTAATAPTSFTAVSGNGSVALSWSAPQDPGGAPVSAYQISQCLVIPAGAQCNLAGQYSTIVTSTNSTGTTYNVSGLANGSTYYFTVAAITSFGVGTSSFIYATNATPGTTPTAVQILDAVPGDGRSVVTWSAPASNGGYTLMGYKVERSSDNGTTWVLLNISTNFTYYNDTSVVNGVNYTYRVSAQNALGYGTPMNTSVVPFGPAAAPANLSTVAGNTQASINWQVPASTGGTALLGYRVEQSTNNSTWTVLSANAGLGTSFVATGLTNGVPYYFRVTAVTAFASNATSTATALPLATATAPTAFAASIDSSGGVVLTWAAPVANGGSPVTYYAVQRSVDGTTWVDVAQPSGLTTTVNGLALGTGYTFRIAAITSVGTGAYATASATPVSNPGAPQNLVASIDNNGVVTLTWATPASNGGSAIVGYAIERCNNTQNTCLPATVVTTTCPSTTAFCVINANNGGSTTAVVQPTAGSTVMTFAVTTLTSVNSATGLATSRQVSGGLVTVVVPQQTVTTTASAPTNLVALAANGAVTLNWTVPSSLGSPAPGSYTYTLQRSVDNTNWTTLSSSLTSATLTYADSGLINGTVYFYRIAAVSTAGTGTFATTSARPFTTAPAPASITATPQDAAVLVTWTAPVTTGGLAITNYFLDMCTTSAAVCVVGATTGFTTVSSAVPAATTSYVVSGLANGTQYWFRVRAVTSGWCSISCCCAHCRRCQHRQHCIVMDCSSCKRLSHYWLSSRDVYYELWHEWNVHCSRDNNGLNSIRFGCLNKLYLLIDYRLFCKCRTFWSCEWNKHNVPCVSS
jgi:titin